MEVYAALVDNIDQNVGRLRAALEELGEWDNTLFIFTSDNGGSREGEAQGTSAYFRTLHFGRKGTPEPFDEDLARLDRIGGPTTLPHYPRGWAMACNTPFRLYKINAHRGGHSVPFVVSWPAGGVTGAGELRRQFVHVTDLLPDVARDRRDRPPDANGGATRCCALAGEAVTATLTDPTAPGRSRDVIIENEGHRGYRRDGWEAVTRHEPRTPYSTEPWELFDMTVDPTQLRDLAARRARPPGGARRRRGRRRPGRTRSSRSTRGPGTGSCCARRGPRCTTSRSCSAGARRPSTGGGRSD